MAPCLFWPVGSAFSALLRSTGNFGQNQNPRVLSFSRLLGIFRLPPAVAAASRSLAPPLSRQTLLTLRSRPLPPVAGRCAIKLRAAPLTSNVRTLRPLWCSSFSRLFLAACWLYQSGSAWVASGRLLPGFTGPARPVSRCYGQPGFLTIFVMPFGFSRYPSSHPCLPYGVSAACLIHSRRSPRQTVLTLRSTPLPAVAGRCAIKPRSAG